MFKISAVYTSVGKNPEVTWEPVCEILKIVQEILKIVCEILKIVPQFSKKSSARFCCMRDSENRLQNP